MTPVLLVAHFVFAAVCCAMLLLWQHRSELAWSSPWRLDHRLDVAFSTGSGEGPSGLTDEQRQALRAICGPKLQKEMRQWLKALCVATVDLEDVAQSVTAEAIRSLPTFDPARGSARFWLHGIALRRGAAHRAYTERHRTEAIPELEREDERPGAEELLVAEGARAEFRAVIRQLPPVEAAVLLGHDLDGIAMAEIARAHGIATSTCYHVRDRALAMLRELLGQRT